MSASKPNYALAPNTKYPQLLKPFAQYVVTLDRLQPSLRHQKSQHRRSVETLGLSGNGDTKNIAKKTPKANSKTAPKQGSKKNESKKGRGTGLPLGGAK